MRRFLTPSMKFDVYYIDQIDISYCNEMRNRVYVPENNFFLSRKEWKHEISVKELETKLSLSLFYLEISPILSPDMGATVYTMF